MQLPPMHHEYRVRQDRARALMASHGVDALLLLTGPTLRYFTGLPVERSGVRPWILLLPHAAPPTLIVHTGRQFEARALCGIDDVRTYAPLAHLPLAAIEQALSDAGLRGGRIGAELGRELVFDAPVAEFLALRDALHPASLVDASALVWSLRVVKSPAEVARVEHACGITANAYEHTFRAARAGMREDAIDRLMLTTMLQRGASDAWVLLTSGRGNYDLVSKGGGARVVEPGDMVWMDAGCCVEGYWSDFSRAGVVGPPSAAQRDAQRLIAEITAMGAQMARPDMPVAEIAARCDAAVAALGLSITSNISALARRVGHGLGLATTEPPSISSDDPTVLEPGMIISIEPGVATNDGTFHIEADVLVTAGAPRILSESPWQLWTIGG